MLLPTAIKRIAGRYLERNGWTKNSRRTGADLHTVMSRRPDVSVKTVIDVGASNGCWSERMMQHLPGAAYFLVEAQEAAHGIELETFTAGHSNVQYELCAAGDHEGEIHFDATEPFGGAAASTPFAKNNITIPMKTVDGMVRRHNLRGPYLLKLDTHGFEVPILEGASEVLAEASMLIIEAYNFTLCPGALRFYELCAYLATRRFRCADMFDFMCRPADSAFWQMDMVFLPVTHPIFQSNDYQPK